MSNLKKNKIQIIKFNSPNLNGQIFTKDSIDVSDLVLLKLNGIIEDFEIDDNGIKVIKKMKINSIDFCNPFTLKIKGEDLLSIMNSSPLRKAD